VTDSDVI